MMPAERLSYKLVALRSGSNIFHVVVGDADKTLCGSTSPRHPAADQGRLCPRCKAAWRALCAIKNMHGPEGGAR